MTIRADSRIRQLIALDVNQTYSESVRISCDTITKGTIGRESEDLRNSMSSAIRRATEQCGSQYTLESTHSIVGGVAVLVTLAATRWA